MNHCEQQNKSEPPKLAVMPEKSKVVEPIYLMNVKTY